jgi:hypothetical protein
MFQSIPGPIPNKKTSKKLERYAETFMEAKHHMQMLGAQEKWKIMLKMELKYS